MTQIEKLSEIKQPLIDSSPTILIKRHLFALCFVHSIFLFWFLVTFGDEVTKIGKYYLIFVYSSQGKWTRWKKRKENHATKVTKNQKTKIWDEQNNGKRGFDVLNEKHVSNQWPNVTQDSNQFY